MINICVDAIFLNVEFKTQVEKQKKEKRKNINGNYKYKIYEIKTEV